MEVSRGSNQDSIRFDTVFDNGVTSAGN